MVVAAWDRWRSRGGGDLWGLKVRGLRVVRIYGVEDGGLDVMWTKMW